MIVRNISFNVVFKLEHTIFFKILTQFLYQSLMKLIASCLGFESKFSHPRNHHIAEHYFFYYYLMESSAFTLFLSTK